MRYILMIIDQRSWSMPEKERAALMKEYDDFIADITASGHFRATSQLHPTSTATTLRLQNGRRVLTDGPFAETKEQLGGFFIVECENLDEAIAIAERIPSYRIGAPVEVRPISRLEGIGTP